METLNLSKKEFRKLQPLELPSEILNTESRLFFLDERKKLILKRIFRDSGFSFNNKIETVSALTQKKDAIGMEELVLPERLVSVNDSLIGWTLPYIENINLTQILNSYKYPAEVKIQYLKQIGQMLEKMKALREQGIANNFYFNDLHENNFIVNLKTNRVNAVDMDSVRIEDNLAAPSRYLTPFSKIKGVSKYIQEENNLGGMFRITDDTEIYCYIVVILKTFYQDSISNMSICEYYEYLNYLNDLGMPKEILDIFSYIYDPSHPNQNPNDYLDQLNGFESQMIKTRYKIATSSK